MKNFDFMMKIIEKILLIQCFLAFSFLHAGDESINLDAAVKEQKNDTYITVKDVNFDKGLITRFIIESTVNNYKLSTNEAHDEIYLLLPAVNTSIANSIPQNISTALIETISLKEVNSSGSILVIKLKSKSFKFFDYLGSSGASLTIDFWNDEEAKPTNIKELKSNNEAPKKIEKKVDKSKDISPLTSQLTSQPIIQTNKNDDKSKKNENKKEFKKGKVEVKESKTQNKIIEENIKDPSKQESMFNTFDKLYMVFAPLKHDIRLPLNPPRHGQINGTNEDEKLYNLALKFFESKKYALALESISEFEKKFPNSALREHVAYLLADVYFEFGESIKSKAYFDKAIAYYKEALRNYPESQAFGQTLLFIGVAYFERGLYYEALGSFEVGADQAEKKKPGNEFSELMRLGAAEVYFKIKDYNTAIERLEILMKSYMNPKIARDAIFRIGDVYFEDGKYKEAIEAYSNAIDIWPESIDMYPNSLFNMAESYFWLDKFEDSLFTYKEFIKHFERFLSADHAIYNYGSNAMVRMAEILEILGFDEETVKKFYLETEFRFKGAYGTKIATLRKLTAEIKTAEEKEIKHYYDSIDKIINESKDTPELQEFASVIKGESLFEKGDFMEALKIWEQHITKFPKTIYLGRLKANVIRALKAIVDEKLEKKEYHEALKAYLNNRARYFTDENSYDSMYKLVKAYLKLGLFAEAENYLNRSEKAYQELKEKGAFKVTEQKPQEDIKTNLNQNVLSKLNSKKESTNETKLTTFIDDINTEGKTYIKKKTTYFEITDDGVLYMKALIKKHKKEYKDAALEAKAGYDKYQGAIKENFGRLLASIFIKQERYEEALDIYKKIKNYTYRSYYNIAYAYEKLLDYGKAIKNYQMLLNLNKLDEIDTKKINFKIADLNFVSGKYKDASELFETYLKTYTDDKDSPLVLYKLGTSYYKQKQTRLALKVWEKVKGDPNAGIFGKMAEESIKNIMWSENFKRQLR